MADGSGKHFSVDARAVLSLGRDSIKSHTTAVIELIKNGYDAGADLVEVEVKVSASKPSDRSIVIRDNGHGMTWEDIEKKWLRIGFSDKRTERQVGDRRRLGEKGIGRLSADRLGSILELRSRAVGAKPVALKIDWAEFEKEGVALSDVKTQSVDSPDFVPPARTAPQSSKLKTSAQARTGTELTVRGLRQAWSAEDVAELHRELSTLVRPAHSGGPTFSISLFNDLSKDLNGLVHSVFDTAAPLEAHFSLDRKGRVECVYTIRTGKRKKQETPEPITWSAFVHKASPDRGAKAPTSAETSGEQSKTFSKLGPLDVQLAFYPKKSSFAQNLNESQRQVKIKLAEYAGVRVFRDGVQVKPYGELLNPEGGDWLGLGDRKARNPAGAARKDFRVAPYQLIGAVFIGRDDNPALSDTSGREGLVHGDAFKLLKAFVLACIVRLEGLYHREFVERKEGREPSPARVARHALAKLTGNVRDVRRVLGDIQKLVPKEKAEEVSDAIQQLSETKAQVDEVAKSLTRLTSEATLYRGLASVGIASVVFSHETDVALDQFLAAAFSARLLMDNRKNLFANANDVLDEINKAIQAGKRIQAWGHYAVRRLNLPKRTRQNTRLDKVFTELIQDLRTPFTSSNITIVEDLAEIQALVFPIDMESLLTNLLTNAYYFVKQENRHRQVSVSLSRHAVDDIQGALLVVSDSGPGVPKDLQEQIWQPLFSTRVDEKGNMLGTGMGLAIVDSVVRELGGTRLVTKDSKLEGARFEIWLPVK